jgi:hypothetical protein
MEASYEKVASRFFLAGGNDHRRRHFLDACFLCKRDITFDRHIFMYKYVNESGPPYVDHRRARATAS